MTEKSESAGFEGLDFGESARASFGVEALKCCFGVEALKGVKLSSAKETFLGEGVLVLDEPQDVTFQCVEKLLLFGLGVSAVLNLLKGEARDSEANLGACCFLVVDLDWGEAAVLVGVVKSMERDDRPEAMLPLG